MYQNDDPVELRKAYEEQIENTPQCIGAEIVEYVKEVKLVFDLKGEESTCYVRSDLYGWEANWDSPGMPQWAKAMEEEDDLFDFLDDMVDSNI